MVAPVQRIVHNITKEVPVERVIERVAFTERLPSTEEMLRRIRYDPIRRRIVYVSPDTGRVIEVTKIPDIAVEHVRPGKQSSDRMSAMGSRYMAMDDSNMRRALEANPDAFFDDVRSLAASVRAQDTTKGPRLPKLKKAAHVLPAHQRHKVSPDGSGLLQDTPVNTGIVAISE